MQFYTSNNGTPLSLSKHVWNCASQFIEGGRIILVYPECPDMLRPFTVAIQVQGICSLFLIKGQFVPGNGNDDDPDGIAIIQVLHGLGVMVLLYSHFYFSVRSFESCNL